MTAMSDDLIVAETLRAEVVFVPGGVDAVLEKLTREVRATPTDISTKAGRTAVASLAHKVSRSKTALDNLGKGLVDEMKAQTAKVDAERRRIREQLDELRDEVRQPLTDWENAEKRRVEGHENELLLLQGMARFNAAEPLAGDVARRIIELSEKAPREWHEFAKRAADTTAQVLASLRASHEAAVRRETERAELLRLRQEAAAREQRERDERLQREAAERARAQAENEAREAARIAHERAEAEKAAVERARQEAEAAAEKARADAKAAAERAERDRVAAAERAERDRAAAVETERRRVAEEKAAADAETARREADKKHRAGINGEVLEALIEIGVARSVANFVVIAMSEGSIPHVKVIY